MSDEKPIRKLRVTSCTEFKRGTSTNKKGEPTEWVMYEIEAVDESGQVVPQKLRSFSVPELNQLLEFEIEKYVPDNPEYAISYTLHPATKKNLGTKVDELRIEHNALEVRLARIEAKLGLESPSSEAASPPAAEPPPAEPEPELVPQESVPDDDVPF